ncbi:acetyl-CoA C-acyltransferase, partial [Bacillus cereus]|nr:acetyl-CoA C-acyltransferase [Bacillus cereus]
LRTVGANNKLQDEKITFAQDEGVRAETTLDILCKLRPAFNVRGSITSGNSSQMSDGAASVLLMDHQKAVSDGLKPLA